jgi:hypothetical protein
MEYRILITSDVIRDGLGLELINATIKYAPRF